MGTSQLPKHPLSELTISYKFKLRSHEVGIEEDILM